MPDRQARRRLDRQERERRAPTHRREVADTHAEGAAAERGGRNPARAKVDVLDQGVGSEEQGAPARADHCRVVARPDHDAGAAALAAQVAHEPRDPRMLPHVTEAAHAGP